MKPHRYILHWIDANGIARQFPYFERARARGAAIVKRAQGMRGVHIQPDWS